MLCANCGQAIEEGKPFCKFCGAPTGQGSQASDSGSSAGASDLQATAIRPQVDATPPPPPPSFVPGAPPPAGMGAYGAGWQPPGGPVGGSGGSNRTGLIVGSIAAGIIVLAGLGVGLWLGLRGDDGAKTDSTKVAVSTTVSAGTLTTGTGTTGSVTTGGGTATTLGGATTTQTLPGLTTTTAGSGTTQVTSPPTDGSTEWNIARENLVMEMDYEDGRIPELATAINSAAPNVPNWVFDELSTMDDVLFTVSQDFDAIPPPPGMEDAHYWLMEAAAHMTGRVQATMDGISVMWYTGSVNSATADFNTGRTERDAYRDAMTQFYSFMPPD